MSSQELPIHPQALQQGFTERLAGQLTEQALDKVAKNLGEEGILGALGEKPWTSYTQILDGLNSAEAEPGKNVPELLDVNMKFTHSEARDNFRDTYSTLLAGVHGHGVMPMFSDDGSKGLTVRNFGHEDLSTGGRVASALFRQQYREALGLNLHLVQPNTLSEMEATGVVGYLPDELQQRIEYQKGLLTPKVGEAFLTSGSLAIPGSEMRRVLKEHELPMRVQRPAKNRPVIEAGTTFSATQGDMPLSTTSIGNILRSQMAARRAELMDPYDARNAAKILEGAYDLVTGGFVTKIGGVALEGLMTLGKTAPVLAGMATDKWRLRQINKDDTS